jgi:nickel-dependent lactate racemase
VKPVNTVIASCGGYPKDINFIQAHKTIHNSAAFVRDGGLLVVFAECPDGIGSQTFLPWFGTGYAAAFARLAERYEGNGGTALAMQTKTARIRICLVTALDRTTCQRIGCDKGDLAMVARLLEEPSGTSAWIANGSLLVNRFNS